VIVISTGSGCLGSPEIHSQLEATGARLILVLGPDSASAIEAVRWAEAFSSVTVVPVSVGRFPPISECVVQLAHDADAGPIARILPQSSASVLPAALPLLLRSLCDARSRTSVAGLAERAGVAPRTLQSLHCRLCLPPPKRLISWRTALWATWQRHRWRRSGQATATDLGFARSSDLTASLRRIVVSRDWGSGGDCPIQVLGEECVAELRQYSGLDSRS
jgi:hypothetical protein